jgi:hypothetical protein
MENRAKRLLEATNGFTDHQGVIDGSVDLAAVLSSCFPKTTYDVRSRL